MCWGHMCSSIQRLYLKVFKIWSLVSTWCTLYLYDTWTQWSVDRVTHVTPADGRSKVFWGSFWVSSVKSHFVTFLFFSFFLFFFLLWPDLKKKSDWDGQGDLMAGEIAGSEAGLSFYWKMRIIVRVVLSDCLECRQDMLLEWNRMNWVQFQKNMNFHLLLNNPSV